MTQTIHELSVMLTTLLDTDPSAAVREARNIDVTGAEHWEYLSLRAAILIDGGVLTGQVDAIAEGLSAWRTLYEESPTADVAYNLANALVGIAGTSPHDATWLDHQERTLDVRSEARRHFWTAICSTDPDPSMLTQAWTNLAGQFGASYRSSEAHDARLAALEVDPENGVAAAAAAQSLYWLFHQVDCSDLTRLEAGMLAKVATRSPQRLVEYAGAQAARAILEFASAFDEPRQRRPHSDPFVRWIEKERLTLSPSVELVDPDLGKVDWLMLPAIAEREMTEELKPPPIFAMFNVLKADFIVARDLAWRAVGEDDWPQTARFSETLDQADYGPESSSLVLAHRTALDLLDKVAATANHYFKLGVPSERVYFGRMWRAPAKKASDGRPLIPSVDAAIRAGASALYGLVELADDYENKDGILRSQKDLRNAGTHRFVVLHDHLDMAQIRQSPEIEHVARQVFTQEVLGALRVARAAIQTLALAVSQCERATRTSDGLVATLFVGDHKRIKP